MALHRLIEEFARRSQCCKTAEELFSTTEAVDHVEPADDGSGLLRLARSKTGQAGEGPLFRRGADTQEL